MHTKPVGHDAEIVVVPVSANCSDVDDAVKAAIIEFACARDWLPKYPVGEIMCFA